MGGGGTRNVSSRDISVCTLFKLYRYFVFKLRVMIVSYSCLYLILVFYLADQESLNRIQHPPGNGERRLPFLSLSAVIIV